MYSTYNTNCSIDNHLFTNQSLTIDRSSRSIFDLQLRRKKGRRGIRSNESKLSLPFPLVSSSFDTFPRLTPYTVCDFCYIKTNVSGSISFEKTFFLFNQTCFHHSIYFDTRNRPIFDSKKQKKKTSRNKNCHDTRRSTEQS